MAIFAAVPLLMQAAHEPSRIYIISIAIYAASLILLYAASTTYHTFDRSKRVNTILKKIDHMMISVLIAGSYTPICLLVLPSPSASFFLPSCGPLPWRHPAEGTLDQLSQMGFFRTLHRHGLDLRPGLYAAFNTLSRQLLDGSWPAA